MIDDIQIKKFWSWFITISSKLGNDFNNQTLLEELDIMVDALMSDVSWEIGPGKIKPNILILTPDGNPALLPVTKHIVSLAPNIDNWEFYYAKPPKRWDYQIEIKDESEKEYSINCIDWEYNLYKFDDGTYDIVLVAPNLANLPEEVKQLAIIIAIDNILGEERRLELIGEVELVAEFENDKGISLKNLCRQLGNA